MPRRRPYAAVHDAQALGFVVKSDGTPPPAESFYVEGPGNDGRGLFNNWYGSSDDAWRAVVRYCKKHGLRPEPKAPAPAFSGRMCLQIPYEIAHLDGCDVDDAQIIRLVGEWLDTKAREVRVDLAAYLATHTNPAESQP